MKIMIMSIFLSGYNGKEEYSDWNTFLDGP